MAPIVNLYGSKTDCADFMTSATGTLTLDGKNVPIQRWRAIPITVSGVAGNTVTQTEGPMKKGGDQWSGIPA